MAGTPTPAYNKAVELLADGRWHERHRVLLEVGKVFPPGEATRHVEYTRQWKAEKEGYDKEHRKVPRSDDFLVMAGQRALAAKVLNNKSRFESKVENGVRFIRLRNREGEQEEA